MANGPPCAATQSGHYRLSPVRRHFAEPRPRLPCLSGAFAAIAGAR